MSDKSVQIEYVSSEPRTFGGRACGLKFRVPELTTKAPVEEGKPHPGYWPRIVMFYPVGEDGKPLEPTQTAPAFAAAELLNVLNPANGLPLYAVASVAPEAHIGYVAAEGETESPEGVVTTSAKKGKG